MKPSVSTTVCGVTVLVLLAIAVPAASQSPVPTDWQLSWSSTGTVGPGFPPTPFHLEGTSPAELVPRPDLAGTFSHDPSGPVYRLTFQHEGQEFGGLVSDSGGWGPTTWRIPGVPGESGLVGDFHLDDSASRFSVTVGGLGHFGPLFEGTGAAVSAAEPQGMLLVAGALGLAIRWRRRR